MFQSIALAQTHGRAFKRSVSIVEPSCHLVILMRAATGLWISIACVAKTHAAWELSELQFLHIRCCASVAICAFSDDFSVGCGSIRLAFGTCLLQVSFLEKGDEITAIDVGLPAHRLISNSFCLPCQPRRRITFSTGTLPVTV